MEKWWEEPAREGWEELLAELAKEVVVLEDVLLEGWEGGA